MNNLSELCRKIQDAKAIEADARKERTKLELELVSLIGVADNREGTETATPDGYEVKITGRSNRTIDGDKLQELAREAGLSDHLSTLFRWKPEINLAVWRAADRAITDPLASAITAKPGKPTVTIKRVIDAE